MDMSPKIYRYLHNGYAARRASRDLSMWTWTRSRWTWCRTRDCTTWWPARRPLSTRSRTRRPPSCPFWRGSRASCMRRSRPPGGSCANTPPTCATSCCSRVLCLRAAQRSKCQTCVATCSGCRASGSTASCTGTPTVGKSACAPCRRLSAPHPPPPTSARCSRSPTAPECGILSLTLRALRPALPPARTPPPLPEYRRFRANALWSIRRNSNSTRCRLSRARTTRHCTLKTQILHKLIIYKLYYFH